MSTVHVVMMVSLVLGNEDTVIGNILFLVLGNNQHVVLCTLHYVGGIMDLFNTANLIDDAEQCLQQPLHAAKLLMKTFFYYSDVMLLFAIYTALVLQVCSNMYMVYILYYMVERQLTAIYTEIRRNNLEHRLGYENDLQTDGPGLRVTRIPVFNLEHRNCDFLTSEEETLCKRIKLSESDKFICMVGSKVDCSPDQLFKYLGIDKHLVYQETVVWELNERDIPEKVVKVLNHWLHLSREGRTLLDLYSALKELKYYYILKYLIPNIRDRIRE